MKLKWFKKENTEVILLTYFPEFVLEADTVAEVELEEDANISFQAI